MNALAAELLGTALLLLLGDGVVANVLLRKTKGEASGWVVVSLGWGFAVFVGVLVTARYSGAHIVPSVARRIAPFRARALLGNPAFEVRETHVVRE